jgi:hypothetical protein
MNIEDAEQLVKDLVDQAAQRKDFGNSDEQLWRQGYLIGLLARMVRDDTYVRIDIESRLKRLDPHRR